MLLCGLPATAGLLHFVLDKSDKIGQPKAHAASPSTAESAFSLLKRGIVGTWHKVSAKHLPASLDEMCFRFNNRKKKFLFRDTPIKLILSLNLEYKVLTARVQDAA